MVVHKWSVEEVVINEIVEIQDMVIMSEDYKHNLDEID